MRIIQIGCRSRPGSPRRMSPDASCSSGGVVAPDNGQAAQSRPNSVAMSQPRRDGLPRAGGRPQAAHSPRRPPPRQTPLSPPSLPRPFFFFFLTHWPLLLAAENPAREGPESGRNLPKGSAGSPPLPSSLLLIHPACHPSSLSRCRDGVASVRARNGPVNRPGDSLRGRPPAFVDKPLPVFHSLWGQA